MIRRWGEGERGGEIQDSKHQPATSKDFEAGSEVPQSAFRNPKSRRTEKKELGKRGEEVALRFLKKKGYRIIEKNYVCKMGEMDIIANEKGTMVFIEVKTRTSALFGPPQLAVNAWKQRQLSKVALNYLKEKRLEEAKARFDVVAILLEGKEEEIELIRNAFDLNWP